jgi:tetratricopeptide (TPR) repeat protein
MLDRVLELWHAAGEAARLASASRLEVLEQAVIAAHLAGEPEHGVRLADAALAEAGAQAEPVRAFFIAERRAAMSLQLRRPDLARLRQAAGRVGEDDPARPRVLAALAERLMDAQLPGEAYECGEQALAAARCARDLTTEASALVTVAALAARRGELGAQLPRLAEAQDIAGQAGMQPLLLRALRWEGSVLEAHGEHERAAAAARRGLAVAAAAGLTRTAGAEHAVTLAQALTALGRWDEAVEVTNHTLSLLPPAGQRVLLLHLAGSIALARGDFSAAAGALREARAQAPASGESFGTFEALMLAELEVALLTAQGDTAAALAAAQSTLTAEGDRTAKLKRFLWPLLAATAEAACAATAPGSPKDLAATARTVLSLAAGHAAAVPPVSPVGRAYQATYHAAAAQADGQMPARAWDGAASAWEQLSEPYRQARALLHAAETALAGDGNRDTAARRLRLAADLADALGAGTLREQIFALARRARIVIARARLRARHVMRSPPRPASPAASSRCCAWWPPGATTGTSRPSCSSRQRPPACTSPTSWPSSGCTPG